MSVPTSIVSLVLFLGSSSAFVSRSPLTLHPTSNNDPRHGQWAERPPNDNNSDSNRFWNNAPFTLPFDTTSFSIATEDSLFDRVTGYVKDAADSALDWANFKPTGTDQTFLGPLQGYVNGLEAQLDNVSDWILSYSDLTPDSERTTAGQAFLATNLAYNIAGALLCQNGDVFFGAVTEITACASFAYHYGQLESRGVNKLPSVRLALLIDYICAFFSIGLALVYLVTSADGIHDILTVLPPSVLALGMLGASWVWVEGRTYMILHGLWHFFSAYTGFLVGSLHSAGTT